MSRAPLPPEATNVLEAFRAAVFSYRDGVPALADMLGTSPTMLYNKANPHDTSHPATLADAAMVIRETKSTLVAQAVAHISGGAFIPLGLKRFTANEEVLALVTAWMREQGVFFAAFDEAIADGKVTPKEHRELTKQAHQVVTACLDLVSRLEGMGRHT